MKTILYLMAIVAIVSGCKSTVIDKSTPDVVLADALVGEYGIFDFYSNPSYGKVIIYPASGEDSFYAGNALQIQKLADDKVRVRVQYKMDGVYYDWYQNVMLTATIPYPYGTKTAMTLQLVSPSLTGTAEIKEGKNSVALVRFDFQNNNQPRYYMGAKR